MNPEGLEKIKIGISSCLMGERVRFDSGHKRNAYINGILSNFFEFTAFCPEVEIGLSIPREPIRLVKLNDQVRCVGIRSPGSMSLKICTGAPMSNRPGTSNYAVTYSRRDLPVVEWNV